MTFTQMQTGGLLRTISLHTDPEVTLRVPGYPQRQTVLQSQISFFILRQIVIRCIACDML